MNITFSAKTTPECNEYFHLLYDGIDYSLEDFAKKYKTTDFSLDEKLKESIIMYRSEKMTYEELGKAIYALGARTLFGTCSCC